MKPASEVISELLQSYSAADVIERYERLWYGDTVMPISAHDLARIISKVEAGEISHKNGKKVFKEIATRNMELVYAVAACNKELERIQNDSRI